MKIIVLLFVLLSVNVFAQNNFTLPVDQHNQKFLFIQYENDLFTFSDRYYSHGLRVDYWHSDQNKTFSFSLLPGLGKKTEERYTGYSFVHNLYTPYYAYRPKEILTERPYCGYIYGGFIKTTSSITKKLKITSRFNLGALGPAAGGDLIQQGAHAILGNKEPIGWNNQIRNDLIADHHTVIEKGYSFSKGAEVIPLVETRLGTLYNNIALGSTFRLGNLDNYFSNLGYQYSRDDHQLQKMEAYFTAQAKAQYVFYDATLQGGAFSQSPYVLSYDQLNKMVYTGSMGGVIYLKHYRIDASLVFITKEIDKGKVHRWGKLGFAANF